MPVLATMVSIALFGGGEGSSAPFFDPDLLREMLKDGLEGVADDGLEGSLLIADDLEAVLQQYRVSVESSLDAYIEESTNPASNATDLIERLAPLDRKRASVTGYIIDARQRLLSYLAASFGMS